MTIRQLSVFIENTPKSLCALTKTMADNKVNMRAISLADTSDFGIIRVIVDDPDSVKAVLKENDYVSTITDVLLVEIPDTTGSLNKILTLMAENDRNVEYMYGFTGKKSNSAYMVMRFTDTAKAAEILKANGINLVSEKELDNL
ncbi:MAG: amino acid-binding protein [Treponema sp.]|nr:amino acid-binding protein [Treponema sp.]